MFEWNIYIYTFYLLEKARFHFYFTPNIIELVYAFE